MASATILEKGTGRVDEHGLLFEYTIKLLVLSAFFELVLYRLVSRLGMHLSKLAAKYEAIRLLFKGLSSIGFTLLNVVSLLLFLAFSLFLISKFKDLGRHDLAVERPGDYQARMAGARCTSPHRPIHSQRHGHRLLARVARQHEERSIDAGDVSRWRGHWVAAG